MRIHIAIIMLFLAMITGTASAIFGVVLALQKKMSVSLAFVGLAFGLLINIACYAIISSI